MLRWEQAGTEQLTVLGRHLAALPLPPRIGKMLLYGVLFGCLDPVLTVTCAMAYRYAPGYLSRTCFFNRLVDWQKAVSSLIDGANLGPRAVAISGA